MLICVYGTVLVTILLVSILIFIYKYRKGGRLYANNKSVFITGCDRGFGYHSAKQLSSIGFKVFAGCLDVNGSGAIELGRHSNRIQTVQLDVTKDQDVESAVKYVQNILGHEGLWGIVNNAGFAVFAESEWCSIDLYQRLIDVNLTGLIRVTIAFLPLVRKGEGRIINIASLTGRCGLPGFSAYSATKFGVIGYSECLRREMSKFNVSVITIEPMMYRTPMAEETLQVKQSEEIWKRCPDHLKADYGEDYFKNFIEHLRQKIRYAREDITPVLESIEDALCCRSPNSRYVPEFQYAILSAIFFTLPYSFQDMAISFAMKNGKITKKSENKVS